MTTPHPILMPFSDLQGFLYQEANHCPLGWLTCAAPTTREPSTAHDLSACYSSVPGVGRHRKQAQRENGSGPRPCSKGPEESGPGSSSALLQVPESKDPTSVTLGPQAWHSLSLAHPV